jgi:hypothetical protein
MELEMLHDDYKINLILRMSDTERASVGFRQHAAGPI